MHDDSRANQRGPIVERLVVRKQRGVVERLVVKQRGVIERLVVGRQRFGK